MTAAGRGRDVLFQSTDHAILIECDREPQEIQCEKVNLYSEIHANTSMVLASRVLF